MKLRARYGDALPEHGECSCASRCLSSYESGCEPDCPAVSVLVQPSSHRDCEWRHRMPLGGCGTRSVWGLFSGSCEHLKRGHPPGNSLLFPREPRLSAHVSLYNAQPLPAAVLRTGNRAATERGRRGAGLRRGGGGTVAQEGSFHLRAIKGLCVALRPGRGQQRTAGRPCPAPPPPAVCGGAELTAAASPLSASL